MLIYGGGDITPFGAIQHKSTRNRLRSTNRVKTFKRVGRRGRKKKSAVKKVKKVRNLRKVKRTKSRKRKLNAKNINFLKSLGLRVKKQ